MTMTAVREEYWIPRLRKLTKKVIHRCFNCKRYRAVAYPAPTAGLLPRDRTEGARPFQIGGVDYAGPIAYQKTPRSVGKCYILLYSCSLTRAVFLDLLPDMTIREAIKSLKRFIARRGRPEKLYSDNFRTFKAAATWLKSEELNDFLATQKVGWQFNLSRAPWWGGQFERMVGLVKSSLYKVVGGARLSWSELEEVLLDVETTVNNRPLSYVEDDEQLPILTPNTMMFGISNDIPDMLRGDEDADMRKRAKHLRKCKDNLWKRWSQEYVKSLRERHNLHSKSKKLSLHVGDVVLIRGDEKNRGKWKMGVVDSLIIGRDSVCRGAIVRNGKSSVERAIQHLYPMELSCDKKVPPVAELNASASEFQPRH